MSNAATAVAFACVALASIGCSNHVITPLYDRIDGKFIDQIDPRPANEELLGGKRESRAIDGQPHTESTLDMFGGWGLMEAPTVKARLDRIVGRLLENYPYEAPKIECFLTSKREFHAYATPYNDIFISLKTLEEVQTEDEMAFILGHEASHILLAHFQREDFFRLEGKAATLAGGAAMVAVVLANTEMQEQVSGGRKVIVANRADVRNGHVLAALSYLTVQEFSNSVFAPLWKRRQEDEADLLAMDLMAKAGYEPRQSLETLRRIRDIEADKEERKKIAVQRYRTAYAPLLLAATKAHGFEGLVKAAASVTLIEGLSAVSRLKERARSPHRLAVHRGEALRAYFKREYRRPRDLDVAASPMGDFRRRIWSGRSGLVLRHHIAAHDALAALQEGRTAEAEALGLRSISAPTSDAPFPRFAMYQIRKAQGQFGRAVKNLEIARHAPSVSGAVLLSLSEEYLAQKRPRDALEVAQEGATRFETEEPFLPIEIASYAALGDREAMEFALARCERMDKDSVVRHCRERVPKQMKKPSVHVDELRQLFRDTSRP